MFYEFNQNNSGGSFFYDEQAGISHVVIVEADTAAQANAKAQDIGIYFDGDGDCPCCGDRWYSVWRDEDGDDEPTIYGQPVEDYVASEGSGTSGFPGIKWMKGYEIFVHYADGSMKMYWKGDK
jgi:hypothetical protein